MPLISNCSMIYSSRSTRSWRTCSLSYEHAYDGMVYYGVVNNIADEESKLGSKYTVPQIAFYKGLLEAIAHEARNDGSITNIDALNIRIDNQVVISDGSQDSLSRLPTSITNFSFSQKEKTLNELIRYRWLSYTSTGKIGLGIRLFLDLRSWFRSNDIPSCEVCNEAGIKASTCPNEGCNVRIHEYCLKKKFSKRKASYLDGIEERKRELNDKLDTLNKKKHDLVQMLKQVLNAEEEIRTRSMQASLRAAMPQPSENTADGSSVSRQAPRMTVDVNFGEVAGESDAGSNQGTPGRPLHHVHSISPSTASFARSPFGSLQHNSGHTPRSPATFSTASPSRFAAYGHPLAHPSVSLPGSNFVASSPSPAASGGSSSVFRDYRPPNST